MNVYQSQAKTKSLNNTDIEFLYGILLVLSRCCLHHLVENSILYKKDIQPFNIQPILFFRK